MTRSRTRVLSLLLLSCLPAPLATVPGAAQELALAAAQAPRFLMPGPSPDAQPVEVDVSTVASLRRRVTLDLERVRLGDALDQMGRKAGVKLVYVRSVVPLDSLVRIKSDGITVAAALTDLLMGLKVDVLVSARGQLAIVPSAVARAAPGTIAGRVVDKQGQSGIAAAEVFLGGTELRTTTAEDGSFRLGEVPPGDYVLFVRRIGYAPHQQKLAVGDGATVEVRIELTQSTTRLDELVTTVTGDQRRLEVGNTIATLNADSLMQTAPVMSFGDLLQGRAPGVLSLTSGGQTGQAGRVRIRGLNSFGLPNDPIVVVDGARVEAGAGTGNVGAATAPTAGGYTGRLADLDPDEIASVEVVKGPSAATLYGTDAANGVIVITTKRGQPGRTRWTAFTEQGLLEQRLDYQDQFPDQYFAFGRSTSTDAPQRCTLAERAAGNCVVDSLASFNTFDNPDTRPFKDGHRQQYGLQVSGGTAGGTTYFLGGAYEQETGTFHMPPVDQAFLLARRGVRELPDWQVRPNAYERVNLRANLTAPLGQRGSATLATGFVSNEARQPVGFPYHQVGYRDGNEGWRGGTFNRRPAYVFSERAGDVVRRFTGSLAASYGLRDWLTLRGTVGADLSTNSFGRLFRRGESGPGTLLETGMRSVNELDVALYSLDFGATATRPVSQSLSSKTSVGVQYNRRAQRGATLQVNNLPLGGETIAGGTITGSPAEATLTKAVAGGYLEEVLGFRDRLFLTGALRFDGGSAFGQGFSVATYPKASISWVVTDASAGPRLPGVNALRLRAAYGASGVQPGPIDALARLTLSSGVNADGTTAAPGAVIGSVGNGDLKPERTTEVEAGFDLELWSSRVRLEGTAYQRTSHDALVLRTLAPDAGGGSRLENLGSVRNRGLELVLSADLLRGRWLAAGFTATGMLNENRLRRVGEGVVVTSPTQEFYRQDVGYPLYGLWGRTVESFADANGNGIIEAGEIVLTDNHYIGPSFPTREATGAPYLRLWGEQLHLSALFQYRGGFHYGGIGGAHQTCGAETATCRAVNDISTPLAEQARTVAAFQHAAWGNYMEPSSYLLLRELSAALTLPASLVRVIGARAGTLVLAGRNLALLWKESGVPIESNVTSREGGGEANWPGLSTYWLLRANLNY